MMENEQRTISRRGFFDRLTTLFLALWGVGFMVVIASYLKTPSSLRLTGLRLIAAGDAQTLKAGKARLVRQGNSPVYVIRLLNNEIVAVSALCTHFRCVLNWSAQDKTLVCPCHNGTFNASGAVIAGLPTRPLPTFPVEVRRGEIFVHI